MPSRSQKGFTKAALGGAFWFTAFLLAGYFIGGAIGGALMAGFCVLSILNNTLMAATVRMRILVVSVGGIGPEIMFISLSAILVVSATIAGAIAGMQGVIDFFNRILAGFGYVITDSVSLAIFTAVVGALLGVIGEELATS